MFCDFSGIPAGIIDLLTGLHSGTESAMKCVWGERRVQLLSCKYWVLGRVADQSHCGESVSNTKVLLFANDAVIFAESLEVLVMALEALHKEVKPIGLQVSWPKTEVQVFGGLLGETTQSIHECGEHINILDSFTYLDSVVHNNGGSHQEVLWRNAWLMVYGLAQHEYLALSVPVQTDKDLIPVQMDKDSNLEVADDPCPTVWL